MSIKAKPNIVLTIDDSTSMNLDFLPDYVVVNSLTNARDHLLPLDHRPARLRQQRQRDDAAVRLRRVGHADGAPPAVGTPPSVAPWPTTTAASTDGTPPVMTSSFNAMFYNPAVTYTAPLKYDGTSYNDMNATNTSTWTQVPADPYLFPTKYVNLQTKVAVGVWCNTDYADKTSQRRRHTISGDHCRINGYAVRRGR